jgi:hypothetical protein
MLTGMLRIKSVSHFVEQCQDAVLRFDRGGSHFEQVLRTQ